jgi:Tfp pilus assembly pilus retraction ATPase PilT
VRDKEVHRLRHRVDEGFVQVLTLDDLQQVLVLVTGPTGSGKSTTMAAIIDAINTRHARHVITVEDPLEFVHSRKKSLFSQREVGQHARSFASALRAAVREDPDVLLVGEMRDRETIGLALAAAEMGILVFGTLHTAGGLLLVAQDQPAERRGEPPSARPRDTRPAQTPYPCQQAYIDVAT